MLNKEQEKEIYIKKKDCILYQVKCICIELKNEIRWNGVLARLQGDIFINGIPLSKMRDWFVMNTGYVRQLATSYYDELTVRENLLFSMNMQASPGMRLSQKLERVEQVIRETGLLEQADIRVGNGTGLGLSGGQVCVCVCVCVFVCVHN